MEPQWDVHFMIKPFMEEQFYELFECVFPSPFRCNVCYFISNMWKDAPFIPKDLHVFPTIKNYEKATLRHCKDCKLVNYCSVAHQKLHWKLHKPLCKAAKEICQEYNVTDVFKINKFVNGSRHHILQKLGEVATRNIKFTVFFNKFCSNCKESLFDCTTKLLKCEKCGIVVYCNDECKLRDERNHEKNCKYIIMMSTFYSLGDHHDLDEKILRKINIQDAKTLYDLFTDPRLRKITDKDYMPQNQLEYIDMMTYGSYSNMATITYWLQNLGMINKEHIEIHIIRESASRLDNFNEEKVPLIALQAPKLTKLTIVDVIYYGIMHNYSKSSNVNFKGRKIEYNLESTSHIQVFTKPDKIKKHPDLLFVNNYKFQDYIEMYRRTICVYSSPNLSESKAMLKKIKANLNCHIIAKHVNNPFKGFGLGIFVQDDLLQFGSPNSYVNVFALL